MNLKIIIMTYLFLLFNLNHARAGDLFVNLFRNPSIGLEYRIKYVSTHIGYYPTIISKDSNGKNETTGFFRTGITLWPTNWSYLSVSHLYGLNGKWKNKSEILYDIGFQEQLIRDRVVLRLGIAVMPTDNLGTKINPTPGISFRFSY